MMKTAIVILNWNGRNHLETYLPSVIENTDLEKYQVVVADNGSTDDSLEFLKTQYPQVELIELDQNYGFAEGYNKALEQVDADIFCLLNSDVRVTANWLDPVISLFQNGKNIAGIQPKILSDRKNESFEHAGAAGGYIDKYGYPFCRGRIMDVVENDEGQYEKKTDIFWASGACLFVRAELFKKNGGFDGDYFAHMEEIDFCWRMKNQGFRWIYCPESIVYHYGGATLDYNNPRKLFLNFRNSLWTLYKNYTGSFLRWVMIRRMLIDTLAIVKFAVTFDFKSSFTIIKAHLTYYKSKPELRIKRAKLQANVITKKHNEILQSSIVARFFVNGNKKFSDLKKFSSNIH